MDTNYETVDLIKEPTEKPIEEAEKVPLDEKPIEELSIDEIKMVINAHVKAIENYEAKIEILEKKHTAEIENLNTIYKDKITELTNVLTYYERKFKLLDDILHIEKGVAK